MCKLYSGDAAPISTGQPIGSVHMCVCVCACFLTRGAMRCEQSPVSLAMVPPNLTIYCRKEKD